MKLLILVSKRQVGGGDLALMTVTGFFTGVNAFFSILFVSIVLTGMYSLLLIFVKKGNRKTEIPFAPFILLATVILVLSGIRGL
jgi:leader peptidase (prepilin peptidase)/N-methyltransferase